MKIHRLNRWSRKAALFAALTCGTTLQLQNCSDPVKNAILQGFSTSTTTLITALVNSFFLTLSQIKLPTTQSS